MTRRSRLSQQRRVASANDAAFATLLRQPAGLASRHKGRRNPARRSPGVSGVPGVPERLSLRSEHHEPMRRKEGDPMPVFSVLGALDVTTAATLRAELTDLLAVGGTDDLVVDLTQMGALDTVGLGLLVGIHRQAQRAGRRLVLTGVPPRMSRVLAITRLNRVLTIDGSPAIPDDIQIESLERLDNADTATTVPVTAARAS